MPPPNSSPLTLSCPVACIGRAAAPVYKHGVPFGHAICGVVPLRRDAIDTQFTSARGASLEAVSSLSSVS
jgi:hypothetical protein